MPASRRTCPECGAYLGSVRNDGKLQCPECRLVIGRSDEGEPVELMQTEPRKWSGAPTRSANRDNSRFEREPAGGRQSSGFGLLIVLGVVIGGGMLLLGGLVLVGAVLWLARDSAPHVAVDPAPIADAGRADQKMAQPAQQPQQQQAGGARAPEPPPPPPPAAGEGGALPVQTLDRLKNATAFIKVDAGSASATGTGFLIHADKGEGLVVTNHHVITPEIELDMPGPRNPRFPLPPSRLTPKVQAITVIFRSGTPQELSVRADVIGSDAEADLAVLRVTKQADLPAAVDLAVQPRLVETMPLFMFGFPFGKALAKNKGNPAITVSKGSVSSLRMDDRGELAIVQIDGELNPGNSGGPVVDGQGRLVGVAVAKVRNTAIGMAVPHTKLRQLLSGRVTAGNFKVRKVERGTADIAIEAVLVDPFNRIQTMTLHHTLAKPGVVAGNAPLPDATKTDMVRDGSRASATISVPVSDKGEAEILYQFFYRDADGQILHTASRAHKIGSAAAAPPPVVGQKPPDRPPVPPLPEPPAGADELTRSLFDARAQAGPRRSDALGRLTNQEPKPDRRDEVRKALEPLLADPDSAMRTATAKALLKWAPQESLPAVLKLLEDDNAFVRWDLFTLLGSVKDERAAEAVVRRLGPDGGRAGAALRAMGAVAEKAVVAKVKSQDNWPERMEACNVLKDIGTAASVPALQETTRDNGPLGWAAKAALKGIEERWPLPAAELAKAIEDLKSADGEQRAGSARRLIATAPDPARRADAVRSLEALLEDRVKDARLAAIKALGRWGSGDTVLVVIKRVEDPDADVRWAVFDAVVLLKDARGAGPIAKRLDDGWDRKKAGETLRAMGSMAENEVWPYLAAGKNHFTRREACAVLKAIGTRESVPTLEEAGKDRDVFVAADAKDALLTVLTRK